MTSSPATTPGHAILIIGSQSWSLHIVGVTRVGRDLFIQLSVVGSRECLVTIRTQAVVQGVTSRQILDAVCDWLLSGDASERAFLDLPEQPDRGARARHAGACA